VESVKGMTSLDATGFRVRRLPLSKFSPTGNVDSCAAESVKGMTSLDATGLHVRRLPLSKFSRIGDGFFARRPFVSFRVAGVREAGGASWSGVVVSPVETVIKEIVNTDVCCTG